MKTQDIKFSLLACALIVLSGLYLYQWQKSENIRMENIKALASVLKKIEKRLEVDDLRSVTNIRSILNGQELLNVNFNKLLNHIDKYRHNSNDLPQELDEFPMPEEQITELNDIQSLCHHIAQSWFSTIEYDEGIELGKINPVHLLQGSDVFKLMGNLSINPTGKSISQEDRAYLDIELDKARSIISLIESEKRQNAVNAIKDLRSKGEYVEYEAGVAPEIVPGVLTGEEHDEESGKSRVFYFYPEKFPEMYDSEKLKLKVAQVALGSLVNQLNKTP